MKQQVCFDNIRKTLKKICFFIIEKLIVLPIDEEIQIIVSSFIHEFEQTGFIESAPKCHKRLRDVYAISNKRIRIVQRTL
jgi:hypothetical protein